MSEANDQHLELAVLNPAQNAIVTDTIASELIEVAREALAELTGVVTAGDAGIEEGRNPP